MHARSLLRAAALVTAISLAVGCKSDGAGLVTSSSQTSGAGGTGGTGTGGTGSGGSGSGGVGAPGGPGDSGGGLTILPTTTAAVGGLAQGVVKLAGDSLSILGGTTAAVGQSLPQSVGGSVVVLGNAVIATGNATSAFGDTLDDTFRRIGALSINPLLGSAGLLTPILSGVGQILAPSIGVNGLVGPVTGPVLIHLAGVVNSGHVSPLLVSVLNPVLVPLISTSGPNYNLALLRPGHNPLLTRVLGGLVVGGSGSGPVLGRAPSSGSVVGGILATPGSVLGSTAPGGNIVGGILGTAPGGISAGLGVGGSAGGATGAGVGVGSGGAAPGAGGIVGGVVGGVGATVQGVVGGTLRR